MSAFMLTLASAAGGRVVKVVGEVQPDYQLLRQQEANKVTITGTATHTLAIWRYHGRYLSFSALQGQSLCSFQCLQLQITCRSNFELSRKQGRRVEGLQMLQSVIAALGLTGARIWVISDGGTAASLGT